VDGVLEAQVREYNDLLPLAALNSINQVRNYSNSKIASVNMSAKCVRRDARSSGELNHAITRSECTITEGNRSGCNLDIFVLKAESE